MPDARIALDAMGGDKAPEETVKGAVQAIERDPELAVVLVGDEERIRGQLGSCPGDTDRILIRHASQVITGSDSPVEALRSKQDSSIRVAASLLACGEVDGLVGAGNTGAVVACATLVVKLLPGVRRPGIAVMLPSQGGGHTIICDAGANITCKPLHLYHYGLMAARYAERMLGIEAPRVGLMNVGSEEGKGTGLVRDTAALFSRARHVNYIGHVEGNQVFTGDVDVIVCEGFVGNVVLKVAEGLFETLFSRFEEFARGLVSESGRDAADLDSMMSELTQRMDWAEYGGAPLLGVNGLVLISHGRSDARAIRNALLLAAKQHRSRVLEEMAADVRAS